MLTPQGDRLEVLGLLVDFGLRLHAAEQVKHRTQLLNILLNGNSACAITTVSRESG